MTSNTTTVAICIATFKRPELLGNCLRSIDKITIPDHVQPIIIVVDNDVEQSAEATFNNEIKSLTIDAFYYVEPDRGICAARNCLLEKAETHQAAFVAFVDDDELTHKQWLANMFNGLKTYPADILAGPVLPITETTAPKVFAKDPKKPSGSIPRNIPAGNVMFHIRLFSDLNLKFDRYFDFIGCEDFDFFDRAIKKEMKAIWIDDAIIFETITPDRETRRYVIYRHFTGGINVVMRFRRHHSLLHAWLRYLPKAIGKLITAIYTLLLAIFISHTENFNKSIIKLSNGVGYLCGLTNIIVERYRY